MFMKKKAVFSSKSPKMVPLLAGGLAMFAVSCTMAGFDILIRDNKVKNNNKVPDYFLCEAEEISLDSSGSMEVRVKTSDADKCMDILSRKAEGGITFIKTHNGVNVGCNLAVFRMEADGSIIAEVDAIDDNGNVSGCFTSPVPTPSFECTSGVTEAPSRRYLLNVDDFGTDCESTSPPDAFLVGNVTVDEYATVTFQAKSSVRILPSFHVPNGSELRAFISGT